MFALIVSTVLTVLSVIALPFLFVVVFCCVLAASGKKIGIRQWYIKVLLRIFNYGARLQQLQEAKNGGRFSNSNLRSIASERTLIERDVLLNADGTLNLDNAYLVANEVSARGSRNSTFNEQEAEGELATSSSQPELSIEAPDSANAPKLEVFQPKDAERLRRNFQLYDAMYFIRFGLEAIIEDDVTKRFAASELDSWNMMTRTGFGNYHFISLRLTLLWWLGFIVRWLILLPFRLAILATGLLWIAIGSSMVGLMPEGKLKKRCAALVLLSGMRLAARSFSAVIRFHNVENRPPSGFCVANHTSPIDVIVLGCDNAYSMIGQRHGGLIGFTQRAFSRATQHIWFERSDVKDRNAVTNMMREHVKDSKNLPVLIFPEGTCINNTTVMLFRKGAFEIETDVYPAAIKYDPRFADPFWNSSVDGMAKHLLKILTSWAIVADVWYLPKQRREPNESPVAYADRVRKMIARAGGLVELDWDGQLKRSQPRAELRQRPQEVYARLLKTD